MTEKWIWLDEKRYPEVQNTVFSPMGKNGKGNFAAVEFARVYDFEENVIEAELCFSGDTEYVLYLNEKLVATGPVSVGGDFLFNDEARSKHYSTCVTLKPGKKQLAFFVRVKLSPVGINEYSRGHGGFMLWGKLTMEGGRVRYITTDESWQARQNFAYTSAHSFDQAKDVDSFAPACETPNLWHTEIAPLKPRREGEIMPREGVIRIKAGESCRIHLEFDKIYAGYAAVEVTGAAVVKLGCIETDAVLKEYELAFCREGKYRGFQLESIGAYELYAQNMTGEDITLRACIIDTCYPAPQPAMTVTDDEALNLTLEVCRHTLKYCRQMIHLDSPKHSEPLACTGDYYIESLMTAMSFGDMELAEFDVVRTAELLRMHDGRMFHTSYSLIWVMMLWDVYLLTGNRALLTDCLDALYLLLERFDGYVGETGLLETPPDYMFVDWIYIDEISMHHPPKALGQTCLCAFYHGALEAAVRIYRALSMDAEAGICEKRAAAMKEAVNRHLYDEEKQLYFDGLNTPTPEDMLYQYMPQNVEKRYYMPHSNILCCAYGICDGERARILLQKVVEDKAWGICQPYFKHYLLEAVYRAGLRDRYTLEILNEWKKPVADCPKGLVEGFVAPEPTYSFDHSHAWGGTPLYSLPKALLGLEILEPAYGKIRLNPSLLGLKKAHVEVPTPRGMIVADLEKGCEPIISIPQGIERMG